MLPTYWAEITSCTFLRCSVFELGNVKYIIDT